MNRYETLLFILFIAGSSCLTSAQKPTLPDSVFYGWKEYFDRSYGPDLELINGIQYTNLFANMDEHPFLGEDKLHDGHVVINSYRYSGLKIKYDIYKQRVILNNRYFSGGTEEIVLPFELIDEFEFNGKLFRKYDFPESGTKYLQVIESGSLSSLYSWSKKFVYSPSSNRSVFNFTPQRKKAYLLINGKLFLYGTKKGFLKLFPENHQKDIKRFIRTNNIWLRKVPDYVMQQLIDYCDKLMNQGDV